MAVVGAPSYFASRQRPRTPEDLTAHDCINLRMQSGGLHAWEFEKGGRELKVRVEGRLVVNSTLMALEAAVRGLRPGLCARGSGSRVPCRRPAGPGARRLVPAVLRLSPVLSEPAATDAGLRLARRCAALPRLKAGASRASGRIRATPVPECRETQGPHRTSSGCYTDEVKQSCHRVHVARPSASR